MLGMFSVLKANVPIGKKIGSIKTEGPVAALHYRATTLLFLCCCILVTSLEWIGNGSSITCAMEGKVDDWKIPKGVIDTYCYIMSTFTLPNQHSSLSRTNTYPGVLGDASSQIELINGLGPAGKTGDVVHKAYYQWVSFMLFFQAMLFYAPHLLFKTIEGGKVRNILCGLESVILDKNTRQTKEKVLARYLAENSNNHQSWGIKLFAVHFLYLVNILFNMFLLDLFLQWEFSTYGLQVVQMMEDDHIGRSDPMARIFPKVTKCTFRKFGHTGTLQIHDAICVLPINIINEKIYVVIWFWLLILAVITTISVLYNIFLLLTPSVRHMLLRNRAAHQHGISKALDTIFKKSNFGDWTLLHYLSKNLEPMVWGELLLELYHLMKERNPHPDDRSERAPSVASSFQDEKFLRARSSQK